MQLFYTKFHWYLLFISPVISHSWCMVHDFYLKRIIHREYNRYCISEFHVFMIIRQLLSETWKCETQSFNKLVYLFFLQSVMILLFFYIKHYLVVILFLRKLFIYTYSQYQDMLIHISLDVMTILQGIFKICTKRNHYILSYIKNG